MTVVEINEMVTEHEVAKNDSPEGQLVGSTAATNRQVAESFGDLSLKVPLPVTVRVAVAPLYRSQ